MLKFSGFADLTSCLETKAAKWQPKLRETLNESWNWRASLFKQLAAKDPMHCMRQGRSKRARLGAQTHAPSWQKLELGE